MARLIDARADQFGFCVALWEALCGRRPFRIASAAGGPVAFLQAIVRGAIDEAGAGTRVPRRILALVRRGLAADRDQRWASMDELLHALERAGRTRRRILVAAIVAGAIINAAALSVALRSDAPPPCPLASTELTGVWDASVRQRSEALCGGQRPPGARGDPVGTGAHAARAGPRSGAGAELALAARDGYRGLGKEWVERVRVIDRWLAASGPPAR